MDEELERRVETAVKNHDIAEIFVLGFAMFQVAYEDKDWVVVHELASVLRYTLLKICDDKSLDGESNAKDKLLYAAASLDGVMQEMQELIERTW